MYLLPFSSSLLLLTTGAKGVAATHTNSLRSLAALDSSKQQDNPFITTTTNNNNNNPTPPPSTTTPPPSSPSHASPTINSGFTPTAKMNSTTRPPAQFMMHLNHINSSTWVDPDNITWYQAQYLASNAGSADICDVHMVIPIADPSRVVVNGSYGMAIENAPYATATTNTMKDYSSSSVPASPTALQAILQPAYVKRFRSRESVDCGFILMSQDTTAATATGASIGSARYCDQPSTTTESDTTTLTQQQPATSRPSTTTTNNVAAANPVAWPRQGVSYPTPSP